MKSRILILIIVLIANVASALGVVYTRHQSRHLAVQIGSLEKQRDEAMADWSRLQLEQSYLDDAGRIESKALNELGMKQPAETQILVIRP